MATKREELKLADEGKGCLGKTADNEPLFVLRAQDRYAPDIVEKWADTVEVAMKRNGASNPARDSDKLKEARALAHQMRAWQELNGSKIPD